MSERSAVVTGAAGGIGLALATELTRRDHRVLLADIDEQGLATAATELDGARAVPTDVGDRQAMTALAEAAGGCDVLCLNAGLLSTDVGPPWESSPAEWDRVLAVNLGGVVNGLAAFVPAMVERGEAASILITASLAGVVTWPGGGPYAASKHAVVAVAEQAALALADSLITVSLLCPALVRTGMSPEGADPAAVATEALDAVDAGVFAIIPDLWQDAVRDRGATLASGRLPAVPQPGGEAGSS
jgi:NAD(P)-dependent dehydrogenase (short-subunit alcohol dehydrogenase family)